MLFAFVLLGVVTSDFLDVLFDIFSLAAAFLVLFRAFIEVFVIDILFPSLFFHFLKQFSEKQQQDDQDDEDEAGGLTLAKKPAEKQTVTPNWTTRVFAMECIRMIIETCKQNKAHLDLAYAREIQEKTQKSKYRQV